MNRYKLSRAGVDVSQGLKRLGNDKELYESLLAKFREDTHFQELKEAMEQKDVQQAFQHAHALKGAAGNLSFVRFYDALDPFVEELRTGQLQSAQKIFPAVLESYQALIESL